MPYTPRRGSVTIRPEPTEGIMHKGLIHLPDAVHKRPIVGEVVEVGQNLKYPDGREIPSELESGQRVLFNLYESEVIDVDTADPLIMVDFDDVLAIIPQGVEVRRLRGGK